MKRLISVVLCMSLIGMATGCSAGEVNNTEVSVEETSLTSVTEESTTVTETSDVSEITESSETTVEETTVEETTTETEESEETTESNETEVTESAETTAEETVITETVPVETTVAETEPVVETAAPTATPIPVETTVEVEETAAPQQPQTDDGRIPYVEGQDPPPAPEGMEYKLVVSVYGDDAWYELRPLPTPVPTHTMEEWMQIQGIGSYVNSDGVTVYGYYVDTSALNEATNEYRVSIGLPALEVVSGDTYFIMYGSSANQACIDSVDRNSSHWHKCTNLTGWDAANAFNAFYESDGHRMSMEEDWPTQMSSASFLVYNYVSDEAGFLYHETITTQIISKIE